LYCKNKKTDSSHQVRPIHETEKPISNDIIDKLINSDYAKGLDSLKIHVKGHRVISSTVGNAGFILYLDNNSWASSFRVEDQISFQYGNGTISEQNISKVNSAKFGDASESITDNKPYSNEANNMKVEVMKSHGKMIEGLSIGDNTFNFAFENGMELDFQLCNDKNNKPSIRVFWEQW
jgi:hypothetical protein